MTRIILVPFDQLNVHFGALAHADKASDLVVLIESERMTSGRKWHKQRLHFLISSARHFAYDLEQDGWNVRYIKSSDTVSGLDQVLTEFPESEVVCALPNSFVMRQQLSELGVSFVENDFFLTPDDVFKSWAGSQKTFTMENFYRFQRRRLDVLMSGDKPVGDRWNFDDENRLAPPKVHDWGATLTFTSDDIDNKVASEFFEDAWGNFHGKVWGTSRAEALLQLDHFLNIHFANFGPFEDAMPAESWSGHHSLLSPYLNNGLLHPSEVIAAALTRFEVGDIPLASCEGFIRQIIGWREYINGMYWFLGSDYRNNNQLRATRPLLPLFHDPATTRMNCVKTIVTDIADYGWTHHIPRLMVLSNLALITGINPQEFLAWMREVFVDAADWVMVPNVIGMATHADGGTLMTKPYAAGGAYISKMGQYCKPCKYDPKKRTGEDACPFTSLYWDFLAHHQEEFSKNHRMFQQLNGLKRLSDLPETRVRSQEVLKGLDAGVI